MTSTVILLQKQDERKRNVLFAYIWGKYIRIQESGKNTDLG
jgi:hypothetical protein